MHGGSDRWDSSPYYPYPGRPPPPGGGPGGAPPFVPQYAQSSAPYPAGSGPPFPPAPYYDNHGYQSASPAYRPSSAPPYPPYLQQPSASASYSMGPPSGYPSGGSFHGNHHSGSFSYNVATQYDPVPPSSAAATSTYPPISTMPGPPPYPSRPSFSGSSHPSFDYSSPSHHYPTEPRPSLPMYPYADSQSSFSHSGSSVNNVAQNAIVPYTGPGRSLKYCLLYGILDVWIHSARNLPNLDTFSESIRQGLASIPVIQNLQSNLSKRITSDPYVCVVLKGATVARTTVISNNQDPEWNEHFRIDVAHKVANVEFHVKDNDMLGSQYIGEVDISAESLLYGSFKERYFDLVNKDGKPCRPGTALKISVEYCPFDQDPLYKYGVGGPPYRGVPNTYFPLRKGGRVTLYQDAHVSPTLLPSIRLAGSRTFQHRSCWDDICQAIVDAQHLIYIAGWSIYTEITLVRDRNKDRNQMCYKTLGELLKWKADKGGVRVLLLVWDDMTSHTVINKVGVMKTHDEETKAYFRRSNVKCLLAPRYADSKLSVVKQRVVGTIYTHHQKTVVTDAEGPGSMRTLIAFLGGLDLCDGRYDSPEHTLFCKLDTDYKDDYHNPTFTTDVKSGGPRQPWHDLHCKIEGPAVYDVLTNFEQRWRRVAKWHGWGLKVMNGGFREDFLLDLKQKSWGLRDSAQYVTAENDPEGWHVQNLVGHKNIAVDTSIQKAYIKAIRSAQHFIYIENQYFLGSSFDWPNYKTPVSSHLVPIEIAQKIVSKIKAHEPFAVYIVIPMWPEGNPTDAAVQEILYFQSQTMEMMYALIAEALKEEALDGTYHPTDFLNFFCLGNREPNRGNEAAPKVAPVQGSNQYKAFKSRRFMIYVHSKGMIVDDEYVIIGSANINQRSMDGSRDTEIAMGAYQPYHTWALVNAAPRGQVYGYRMSLWAEHLRANEQCFMEPWSQECVKTVKRLAQQNWDQFSQEDPVELEGHLLQYPLKVTETGKVVSLDNFTEFPDVGGKILGSPTNIPDELTA
ncbi:hypothetical protein KP509_03G080700 [Ceratopteris richardii]|uniref:phospholipase D n=1 Tax=Ceratopteris richardii TaxID=49495 RepID=A0A8T2V4Z9_CERRI|nr:hypothetical protein KP509_03G080700 [Ceratopteris richardii]